MPQANPQKEPWASVSEDGGVLRVRLPDALERKYLSYDEGDFQEQAEDALALLSKGQVGRIVYQNEAPGGDDLLRKGFEASVMEAAIYEEKYGKLLSRLGAYLRQAVSPAFWSLVTIGAVDFGYDVIQSDAPVQLKVIGGVTSLVFGGLAAFEGWRGFQSLKEAFEADKTATRNAELAIEYLDLAQDAGSYAN
ncbi:MAG: hypothetical protein V1820_06325 [archaeon]